MILANDFNVECFLARVPWVKLRAACLLQEPIVRLLQCLFAVFKMEVVHGRICCTCPDSVCDHAANRFRHSPQKPCSAECANYSETHTGRAQSGSRFQFESVRRLSLLGVSKLLIEKILASNSLSCAGPYDKAQSRQAFKPFIYTE